MSGARDETNQTARRASPLGFEMNVTRKNADAPDPPAPDPKAAKAIGQALEAHYADLVQAPLPDKFVDLLARLEGGAQSGAEPSEQPGRRNAVR
jgi:Anti-sigma factor NepR